MRYNSGEYRGERMERVMVTHRTEQAFFVNDALFEHLQAVLAKHGVSPPPEDYDEADLLRVAEECGYEVKIEREDDLPGWLVEFTGYYTPTEPQISDGRHPNRIIAILSAFEYALTWISAEEEQRRFDQHARELMNMSGEEFMRKVHAKEVDFDDSRVEN